MKMLRGSKTLWTFMCGSSSSTMSSPISGCLFVSVMCVLLLFKLWL